MLFKNAAEMRFAPARNGIGLVLSSMPFGSACDIQRSISITETRSPFTEISTFSSNGEPAPYSWPVGDACINTVNTYSPSAGKLCTTDKPPRVPTGVPSTCAICEARRGNLYVDVVDFAVGSPIAMRAISLAASKYASINIADGVCTSAMLSKLALLVSSGSQEPASMLSPSTS